MLFNCQMRFGAENKRDVRIYNGLTTDRPVFPIANRHAAETSDFGQPNSITELVIAPQLNQFARSS